MQMQQQMQQQMQEQMAATQEALATRTVEATAGAVKAVVTCAKVVQAIEINPEAIDPEDREFLQDMIKTAVNEALEKADAVSAEEMGKITSGLNLPGMGGGFPGF